MKATQVQVGFKKLLVLSLVHAAQCSISGLSYMDPLKMDLMRTKLPPGEDPCNPLYWYPRSIPQYCYLRITATPVTSEVPPVVFPLPPKPVLDPLIPPSVPILPMPSPHLIVASPPLPLFPAPPNPFSPLDPVMSIFSTLTSSNSFPYYSSVIRPPAVIVPGIHGLVTKGGGINIMPFSDAYADMFEKHKNKIIRRKLHTILDKYEYSPRSRNNERLRKYEKYFTDDV